ncbi:MAG: hypothetical protein QXG65_04845 [Thermoplasmata archaeon]
MTSAPRAAWTDGGGKALRSAALRTIVVDELSLATAPIEALERMSRRVDQDWIDHRWESDGSIEEMAVLKTCHRIEIIRIGPPSMPPAAPEPIPASLWRRWTGRDAVEHLYRVGMGLESLARGEREVRLQVQATARRARSRVPRPILRELLGGMCSDDLPPGHSIATVAADRLLQQIGRPFPRVVVIGTGTVGRQVVEALGPYARTTVVYRTAPPPPELLRTSGARAVPLEELDREIPLCDGLIAAAKTGERILRPEAIGPREAPLAMIDLGIPRNIDPACATVRGVTLWDLQALYHGHLPRGPAGPSDRMVRERADGAWRQIEARLAEPPIDALMRRIEAIRAAEVARALPHFGTLSGDQRQALEHLSRKLVRQVLRGPLERLRAMPPGPERDAAVAVLAESTTTVANDRP